MAEQPTTELWCQYCLLDVTIDDTNTNAHAVPNNNLVEITVELNCPVCGNEIMYFIDNISINYFSR